jgi:hypothetical protein
MAMDLPRMKSVWRVLRIAAVLNVCSRRNAPDIASAEWRRSRLASPEPVSKYQTRMEKGDLKGSRTSDLH